MTDVDLRESWLELAACRGHDLDMFFPARGDNLAVRRAKAVCAGCQVRSECLAANLEMDEGIFGATSALQRRQIRAQRRRVPPPRRCKECGTLLPAGSSVRREVCSHACQVRWSREQGAG